MLDRVKNRELLFSVLALWTFAVAKPLLDVLEPTPEYWVANRIEGWTIVLIVLTLSVAIPVVLSTVLLVGKRIGRRGIIGASLFGVVFVVLAAIGIYHSLSFVLGKLVVLAAGSLAAAFLALWVYHRFEAVRNFFSILGVLSLIVPVSFLFLGPTQPLLAGSKVAEEVVESAVELTAPVIIVVFDEMSLASLLNEEGEIDERLFPNFSRLANISTWFQNASANYGGTERSIPSLLTGKLHANASYKQEPQNLFTLVDAPDGVFAMESVTQLCPPHVCMTPSRRIDDVLWQVINDFALIYQNVLVPDKFSSNVASIPHRFDNLAGTNTEKMTGRQEVDDGSAIADRLSQWFSEGGSRSLVYLHFGLPHAPYEMNVDGTKYTLTSDYKMLGWEPAAHEWLSGAEFHVVQGFQRYLLQTMYADKVLGEVLNCLVDHHLLESSTIVVTADHGVSFTPGYKRRSMGLIKEIMGENNGIPLFWKKGKQSAPARSMRNVELIDVLPTLLVQLGGGDLVDQFDGVPVESGEERPFKVFGGEKYAKNLWPEIIAARNRLFSSIHISENSIGKFFPIPKKYHDLIGQRVAGAQADSGIVEIENPLVLAELSRVGMMPRFTPNHITGRIYDNDNVDVLVVSVNGVIVDAVDVFVDQLGQRRFASTFDPFFLQNGANEIEIFSMRVAPSGERSLYRLSLNAEQFKLTNNGLVDSSGRPLRLEQHRLIAAVDALDVDKIPGVLHISGWMGDRSQWRPPLGYLISYGEQQFMARTTVPRPDLASFSKNMTHAGFSTTIRFNGKFDPNLLRIFVLFDNESYAEMEIRKGMQ